MNDSTAKTPIKSSLLEGNLSLNIELTSMN